MADQQFDFSSNLQTPDYSQILRILQQRMNMPNPLAQGIDVAGQLVGQAIQQNAAKQKQQKEQQSLNDWISQQQQPVQKTMDVMGQPNTPIASYNEDTNQTTPMTNPNPNAGMAKSLQGLPPDVLMKIIGPMMINQQKQYLKSNAPLSKGMQAEMDMSNKKYSAGAPGTPKGDYYASRANQSDISGLSLIEKNIDPSVAPKTTPVGAAAQSVRRVYNGLTLLNNPIVTKTALEATTADIDSILTQASATVEGRKMLETSNVYQKVQSLKSYLSSSPDKMAVTPGLKNIYSGILKDLGPISQKFVLDRVKQQGEFYRTQAEKTIPREKYDAMLQRVTGAFTIPSNLMGQGGGNATPGQPTMRFNPQTGELEPL